MSPNSFNTPRDELLDRYEQAKAQLPDGLPDAPSAATRERIMQAAREQADTITFIAPRAGSMPAIGLNSSQNTLKNQTSAVESANDSFWNIRAVASLAIMGLSALLWWQFENGTPEEQQAAKSSLPAAETAPAPAPTLVTPATNSPAAPMPAPAAAPAAEAALSRVDKPIAAAPATAATAAKPQAALEEPSFSAAPNAKSMTKDNAAAKSSAESAPTASSIPATEPAERARSAQAAPASRAEAPAAAPVVAAKPAAPSAPSIILPTEPLFSAIEQRNAPALRQALRQGISPNARAANGNAALTQAVIQRWADGVNILLAAGADRSAKNSKGHTAVDVALEFGYLDMTELLAAPR